MRFETAHYDYKTRRGAAGCSAGLIVDDPDTVETRGGITIYYKGVKMTLTGVHPVNIVPFESLVGKNNNDATFRYLNRESSSGQEDNHGAKITALEEAHARLGVTVPFVASRFTGSGTLDVLHLFFHTRDKSVLATTYFGWLEDEIRRELDSTLLGTPLYIVFFTQSRMMRPAEFDTYDQATWEYTANDYDIFGRWLNHCFGDRAEEITFVLLHTGTPEDDRANETKAGMRSRGKMGGRPRNRKPPIGRQLSNQLQGEAIDLAKNDAMNAGAIWRYFNAEYQKEVVSLSRIQKWLRQAGIATKRGRPQGSTKNSLGKIGRIPTCRK